MRRMVAVLAAFAAVLFLAAPASAVDSYDGGDDDVSPTETSQPAGDDVEVGGIVDEPETAGDDQLPATGSDTLPLVQIGVGLLVIGGMATLAVRSRQIAPAKVDDAGD